MDPLVAFASQSRRVGAVAWFPIELGPALIDAAEAHSHAVIGLELGRLDAEGKTVETLDELDLSWEDDPSWAAYQHRCHGQVRDWLAAKAPTAGASISLVLLSRAAFGAGPTPPSSQKGAPRARSGR